MNDILDTRVKDENPVAYCQIQRYQRTLPQMPLAIEQLCREIDGLSVGFDDLGEKISGCIFKRKSDHLMLVNKTHPATRQRFTIAHELAHFLLHKDKLGDEFPENLLMRSGLHNRYETEANKLAAEILMPYEAIDRYIEKNGNFTIREMARSFGVSSAAMSIRLGIPLS